MEGARNRNKQEQTRADRSGASLLDRRPSRDEHSSERNASGQVWSAFPAVVRVTTPTTTSLAWPRQASRSKPETSISSCLSVDSPVSSASSGHVHCHMYLRSRLLSQPQPQPRVLILIDIPTNIATKHTTVIRKYRGLVSKSLNWTNPSLRRVVRSNVSTVLRMLPSATPPSCLESRHSTPAVPVPQGTTSQAPTTGHRA